MSVVARRIRGTRRVARSTYPESTSTAMVPRRICRRSRHTFQWQLGGAATLPARWTPRTASSQTSSRQQIPRMQRRTGAQRTVSHWATTTLAWSTARSAIAVRGPQEEWSQRPRTRRTVICGALETLFLHAEARGGFSSIRTPDRHRYVSIADVLDEIYRKNYQLRVHKHYRGSPSNSS